MSSADPLAQLVQALLDGTKADTVEWEQADARGRSFIAKGSDGTVTLSGVPTDTIIGPIVTARLVVKNAAGRTIEEYDTAPPTATGALTQAMLTPHNRIESKVRALFELVKERMTKANATMTRLAKEFEPN